jgi:hypothetical protein
VSSSITTPNQSVLATYSWLGTVGASASRRISEGVTTLNEVANPSFASGTTGWASASVGTLSYNSADQRMVFRANATTSGTLILLSGEVAGIPGQTKAAGMTVYNTSITDLSLRLVMTAGGSFLYGPSVVIQAGGSAFVFLNPTAIPASASSYSLQLLAGAGAPVPSGATFEVDNVMARTSPRALTPDDYFDGSTPTLIGVETSRPLLVTRYESRRQSNHIFQQVIGGGQDVTMRPASLRTGTLVCLFRSEAEAQNCEAMHSGTSVLTFADSDLPTVGMKYVPSGSITRALDDVSRVLWTVSIDFQEVQE